MCRTGHVGFSALRGGRPREAQIPPKPCGIYVLELEGEHKPEFTLRGITLDESADLLPSVFKAAGTEMKRSQQANLPADFNPFRYDRLRRIDDTEPEACVGRWKMAMQTVSAVGVLGQDRIQGVQNGIEVGTGFVALRRHMGALAEDRAAIGDPFAAVGQALCLSNAAGAFISTLGGYERARKDELKHRHHLLIRN